MALTMDELKDRYYKLVLEKADKMYSSWEAKGITSKRLVTQANAYAFDPRLKADAGYRFHVLTFTVALGIRLEKRYGTFFRRLFRFFAYLRERSALKMLKRVFGFPDYTDIREMIAMEVENISVLLSHQENQQSTGGGKQAVMGDIAIEESFNHFLEACIQEDEPSIGENNLEADKAQNVDAGAQPISTKAEDTLREKISLEKLGKTDSVGEKKKETNAPTKTAQAEKEKTGTLEAGIAENEKIEKPVKTVASQPILTEITISAQEPEENLPSPFPIFRDSPEGKTVSVEKEKPSSSEEKYQTKSESENGGNHDKDIREDADRDKSPFPVFQSEKADEVKAPEKTTEKETREIKKIEETKEIKGTAEKIVYAQSDISEENKARIALNITMGERKIQSISEKLIAAADMQMEREEKAWREKISIANNGYEGKVSVKQEEHSSGKNVIGAKSKR